MGIVKYLEQTLKKLNLTSLFYMFYFCISGKFAHEYEIILAN